MYTLHFASYIFCYSKNQVFTTAILHIASFTIVNVALYLIYTKSALLW